MVKESTLLSNEEFRRIGMAVGPRDIHIYVTTHWRYCWVRGHWILKIVKNIFSQKRGKFSSHNEPVWDFFGYSITGKLWLQACIKESHFKICYLAEEIGLSIATSLVCIVFLSSRGGTRTSWRHEYSYISHNLWRILVSSNLSFDLIVTHVKF